MASMNILTISAYVLKRYINSLFFNQLSRCVDWLYFTLVSIAPTPLVSLISWGQTVSFVD